LSPIHLIVPTSDSVNGERTFPIISVFPVAEPGDNIEEPLNTFTSISFPARVAAPTSIFESTGSPMRVSSDDFEVKRARPSSLSMLSLLVWDCHLRLKDGIDIITVV
jgi:hypothetical protein